MTLPDNMIGKTAGAQDTLEITMGADNSNFTESVEEARKEVEALRDAIAGVNAELSELNETLPPGTEAEIHRVGDRSLVEISRPDSE